MKLNKTSHGHTRAGWASPEYRSWQSMKNRCLNPNAVDWHRYGGRGITIIKRWLKFENFLIDMGRRPAGLTLDRKNPDGNYSKRNCRWASQITQQRNRTNTLKPETVSLVRHLIAKGYSQSEVARRLHTTQSTVWGIVSGRVWR